MPRIKTGKVRFSYLHVFEPHAFREGDEPKYSVSIIVPKSDTATIDAINKAVKQALQDGKAKFGGKIPTNFSHPLRDGDDERPDDEAYSNSYFFNANSKTKPSVAIAKDGELYIIEDPEVLYSGCYGKVTVDFYPFNVDVNKGVACGLGNLLKLADGDPLGVVKPSATQDFEDDLEDDDFGDDDLD